MERRLRVEFHCHSDASHDSLSRVEDLVKAARKAGLERLMLTDHNTIRGALRARRLDPELVIVGEEVLTLDGELLAYFVKEEVPPHLPPEEAIALLRQQGAFISVPHPFDLHRHGWASEDLRRITPLVDAIEVFNARVTDPRLNALAQQYAHSHDMPGTVGSDAHTLREVGRASLSLPYFDSAESLKQVIAQGVAQTRLSSPLIHLSSTFAKFARKLRKY
jgi:predicted metal-dependent phosphoesterase TrpH